MKILVIIDGTRAEVLQATHIFSSGFCFVKDMIHPSPPETLEVDVAFSDNCNDIIDIINYKEFDIINYKEFNAYPFDINNFNLLATSKYRAVINMSSTKMADSLIVILKHLGDNFEKIFVANEFINCVVELKCPIFYYFTHYANQYCVRKPSHPIDIVYKAMPASIDFPKIVGISIGEGEDPTVSPPVSIIVDLVTRLTAFNECHVCLFGNSNNVRERMIMNQISSVSHKHVTLVTSLGTDARVVSQALQMCNAFIAYDGFLMHLAVAMDVPTIGLFANTKIQYAGDHDNLIEVQTAWTKKCDCPKTHCSLLDNASGDIPNCFYSFDTVDIAKHARMLAYGN